MLKDIILSFKENIKNKTTNPFFGTFLIVAIIRNWDFIITLTNLDLYYTLDKKKEVLSGYFQIEKLLWGTLTNTWVTIIVIILTYGLLNISRLIVNFFDKVITPEVYRLTDKGSVVLKTEYTKLNDDKGRIEQRLEKERETRLKVQAERDDLESRMITLISKANNSEKEEEKEITPKKAEAKENNLIESVYSMIKSRNFLDKFKHTIDIVEAGTLVRDNDEGITYFVRLGLIKKIHEVASGTLYHFTELGQEFRKFLLQKGEM